MRQPNMRCALRSIGGRRVTAQIIKQAVVDRQAVQQPQDLERATFILRPMPPHEVKIKPEGQRKWKWWKAFGAKRLELNWRLKVDRDDRDRLYKVMEEEDESQAGFRVYQLTEEAQ